VIVSTHIFVLATYDPRGILYPGSLLMSNFSFSEGDLLKGMNFSGLSQGSFLRGAAWFFYGRAGIARPNLCIEETAAFAVRLKKLLCINHPRKRNIRRHNGA
jgi:hypothetical protein